MRVIVRSLLVAAVPTLACVAVIAYALHATGFPVSGVAGAWPFLVGVYAVTFGCSVVALGEDQ